MGKRARKTRWRALDIADEHSDSEESNTNSSAVSSRNSRSYSNGYYSKYSYSSQSTPARRRYNQYDGSTKSTRSSSTTSENKITFNEDEYTRITTPRQDVLFKKGYLNKPKNYQTQTSTGNSTVSTGNSTENGTPDHQSTDLDYESQFMFPNGFVDQNGIYYVNSYEPYPLMLFNPPTYYHECSDIKSKRMSTGSLSESMSPNNEEATSQDLSPSGGDASNSVSDYSGGPPVYNMIFPGYYVNDACTPTDLANGQHFAQEPVKKFKKRRERKSSKNIQEDSSENTDDNSCDENLESSPHHPACSDSTSSSNNQPADSVPGLAEPDSELLQKECHEVVTEVVDNPKEELKTVCENLKPVENTLSNGCAATKTESNEEKHNFDLAQSNSDLPKPSVLKPDAEEFIPRSYLNLSPSPHIKMLPPNFMPIPLVPINDFGGQSFAPHPAFIPPGIPINFIPHHPGQKIFPPAPGFVNFVPPMIQEAKIEENPDTTEETVNEDKETQSIATPSHTPVLEESKLIVHSKVIDIATVVSKLEAVKQQEKEEIVTKEETIAAVVNETKPFIGSPRLKKPVLFKRNYYNKHRSSPVHNGDTLSSIKNGDNSPHIQDSSYRFKNTSVCNGAVSPQKQINLPIRYEELSQPVQNGHADSPKNQNSPVRNIEVLPPVQNCENSPSTYRNSPIRQNNTTQLIQNGNVAEIFVENGINQYKNFARRPIDDSKQVRNSPERLKKNWKPNGYQNGQSHFRRAYRQQNNQNSLKPIVNMLEKHANDNLSPTLNGNYSESLKKTQIISDTSSAQSKKHINEVEQAKTVENIADAPLKSELVKPKSNQWISVSNRKKKKNKNTEDVDFDADQDILIELTQSDHISSDFENYDITQLVDVVPTSLVEEETLLEKKIEGILTIIAQNEPSEVLTIGQQTPSDIIIPEVSDIEKDIIIIKIEEEVKVLSEEIPIENVILNSQTEKEVFEKIVKETLPQINDEQEKEMFKPKKKSKKGTQKPLTKKVIITDIDLSMTATEVKTPVKKIVTKVEEANSVKTQSVLPVVNASEEIRTPAIEPVVNVPKEICIAKETTPEVSSEQTEKKSKKKKKNKSSKSVQNGNLLEATATLNPFNESYDPPENSLLGDSLETTNDDISLELEKLIQKGMFSSLQEKIKSINVEPEADGFFKNFQAAPPSNKENVTTANGFMKTPDFNRIFQSTRQFLKPNMVSLEKDNSDNKVAVDDIHNKDIKTSSSGPDAADPSAGLFLDNAEEVQEVQKIQEATTKITAEPKAPAKENEDQEDNKKLYPITQAVKEWMSKTREATPEVEILKSPSTIQREFGDNGISNDGLNDPLDSDEEDEVTLFCTDDTFDQEQPDLLEYWENDVSINETEPKTCEKLDDGISNHPKICSGDKSCTKCQNDSIKECGEEIKVYESKYGQNEALLDLHRELKEKEANTSRPKSLPHRTACCSLQ